MEPYRHQIKYYETDKMSITHHSNYVRFMEEARIYFLEQIGWGFDKIEEQGIVSPVMNINCNYKKTTTFPDVLDIYVWVEKITTCKMTFGYKFMHNDDVVFTATSMHCFLNQKGQPVIVEKEYPGLHAELLKYLKTE